MIGYVSYKLKTGEVVDLNLASIRSEHELVVSDSDLREVGSFLLYGADKFSLRVENQELSILTQDNEEPSEVRNLEL